jgi:hypothetical protein
VGLWVVGWLVGLVVGILVGWTVGAVVTEAGVLVGLLVTGAQVGLWVTGAQVGLWVTGAQVGFWVTGAKVGFWVAGALIAGVATDNAIRLFVDECASWFLLLKAVVTCVSSPSFLSQHSLWVGIVFGWVCWRKTSDWQN